MQAGAGGFVYPLGQRSLNVRYLVARAISPRSANLVDVGDRYCRHPLLYQTDTCFVGEALLVSAVAETSVFEHPPLKDVQVAGCTSPVCVGMMFSSYCAGAQDPFFCWIDGYGPPSAHCVICVHIGESDFLISFSKDRVGDAGGDGRDDIDYDYRSQHQTTDSSEGD